MKLLLRSQSIGIAALLLGTSVFLSRVLGLVRDKVISYYFGAGAESDIYFMAFVIPDYLNYLLAGGYFSITLVPLLVSYFNNDEEDAWRFFSSTVCWAFIAITTLTVCIWIFVEPIATFIAPGFSPESLERLCLFLRIILPAQICFLPGACFTAMLYYRKQFSIPALTPLIYNGCIILGGVIWLHFFPKNGMIGFCWGVLCGAFLGSFLLPIYAVASGKMYFRPNLRHPGIKRVLLLALPLMLGQSIVVLDEQFVRIFGTMADNGSVSLLGYARRIMQVPVGVIAQAAGLASYPFLASLAASGNNYEFNKNLRSALSTTVLVALPVSLWMIIAAEPIMRLIFQQGNFTSHDASMSGLLLGIMMLSVSFWSIQQVLGRAFYAHQSMVTPAVIGSIVTAISLPLYYFGVKYFGAPGIATAGSLGVALYTFAIWQVWKKQHGFEATQGIIKQLLKATILCLPACVLSFVVNFLLHQYFFESSLLSAILRIIASGLVFVMAYFVVLLRFDPKLCSPFSSFCIKIARKLHIIS